jgi:hypothetical protein
LKKPKEEHLGYQVNGKLIRKIFLNDRDPLKKLDYEKGFDNVFDDLGLPNAEELKDKTMESIQELREGRGIKCESIDDFWEKMGIKIK